MPRRRSDARPLRLAGDSEARRRILGGTAIGGVLALWAVIGATGWVTPFYLPPLPDVLAVAARMLVDGTLVNHALVSLGRVLAGFALAVAVALPVGMAMGLSSRAHYVLEPWIELVRPIPPIAWIPMAILWLGIDEASKVFIIAYGAFFPIMLNSMAGFRDLDPLHLRAAQILGATRPQIFWHVVVRSASRRIVTGLRRGHSHRRALRAVGAKWLKIIFVMWQRQVAYDEQYHLATMARQALQRPDRKIA